MAASSSSLFVARIDPSIDRLQSSRTILPAPLFARNVRKRRGLQNPSPATLYFSAGQVLDAQSSNQWQIGTIPAVETLLTPAATTQRDTYDSSRFPIFQSSQKFS